MIELRQGFSCMGWRQFMRIGRGFFCPDIPDFFAMRRPGFLCLHRRWDDQNFAYGQKAGIEETFTFVCRIERKN